MLKNTVLVVCFTLLAKLIVAQSVFVGGTIFVDTNDNGIRNFGERTLGECGKTITLELYTQDSILVATTLSDARGFYFFESEPGNYFIRFVPPASLPISSSITNPVDDGRANDDNGIQNDTDGNDITDGPITTNFISLSIGEEPTNELDEIMDPQTDANFDGTIDFGLTGQLGIGGTLYIDLNDNGIFDPTEDPLGLNDIQVQMDLLDISGSLIQSTMTDSKGRYEFITKTGNYFISFTPPWEFARSSSITNLTDDNTSLDDNGIQEDLDGDGHTEGLIISPIISLSTGEEPIDEPSIISPIRDENADFTIDFGLLDTRTSVIEIEKTSISISPNPASEMLIIQSEFNISSIELRQNDGQLIKNTKIFSQQNKYSLDVSALANGSYIVVINTPNGRGIEKFVKL